MAAPTPLVVAHEAGSHLEAQILRGLLRAEGIAARVAGEELSDEFAQAARLTGGLAQVLVPRESLDQAQHILAAHAEARTSAAEAAEEQWNSGLPECPDNTA
ncbi:MAG: DUF2007 domain-containing protein [Planctomycetes bacterium]|nr:DUF2007 domain-containing protein [Planctomycetota bacterium]MDA0948974.1 DUF2007 domain-containing protein [Planctomycetota bacterium]